MCCLPLYFNIHQPPLKPYALYESSLPTASTKGALCAVVAL